VKRFNIDTLQSFVSEPVDVAILDEQGEERAPFVRKTVQKLEICPDQTHLRIYFDKIHFFAVPLHSRITQTSNEWSALDHENELQYIIRKVDKHE
jgi:hypothetical protein